jgi:DNA-binding NarL/FixJ family response regulator
MAQAVDRQVHGKRNRKGAGMSVQIVIGEHEEMLREGFVKILNAQKDMTVAGQAADGQQVVHLAASLKPHVVVMDTDLPVANGLEATRRICKHGDAPAVILLSLLNGPSEVAKALEAGASAHIGHDCTPAEFVDTVRRAVSARTSNAASRLGTPRATHRRDASMQEPEGVEALTPREREVLQLFSEGYASKEVGDTLQISIKTVSTHRVHIGDKLHTRSLAGMTKCALKAGLARL